MIEIRVPMRAAVEYKSLGALAEYVKGCLIAAGVPIDPKYYYPERRFTRGGELCHDAFVILDDCLVYRWYEKGESAPDTGLQ